MPEWPSIHPLLGQAQAFEEYVHALTMALLGRDVSAIDRLLGDPLATHLPRTVVEEAILFRRLPAASGRAPMQTLRFGYRLAQLGAEASEAFGLFAPVSSPDGDVQSPSDAG